MDNVENKTLTCFCYWGGRRIINANGTFLYNGGTCAAVLLSDGTPLIELCDKVCAALKIDVEDKMFFYNTKRDKTKYVTLNDENAVTMLFHLNEGDVDVFVEETGCSNDPVLVFYNSTRESNAIDSNSSNGVTTAPNSSHGGTAPPCTQELEKKRGFLGKMFEIAKKIGEMEIAKNTKEWVGYHGLAERLRSLKRKVEYSSTQEDDINNEIDIAECRPGKRRMTEVEVSLRDVQRLKEDVTRLEQEEVAEEDLLSRVGLEQRIIEKRRSLKRKVEYLCAQESDINREIDIAECWPWKRRRTEVEVWLRDVQLLKEDVRRLEQEVAEEDLLSRVRLEQHIIEKTQEVEALKERGRDFNDLLVDEFQVGQLLVPPTKDFVESTEARNVERVWECLMNEDDRLIGVFGMGGVGKTTIMKHIHNQLLKETGKFDSVFWVTVSKPFNIIKLQRDIAKELNIWLSHEEDETRRALELYEVLSRWKRYILILDDLWEVFPLELVGIPEPTRSNGCKLVLTTRSLEVCTGMRCKSVKVELLTEQESLALFLSKAGKHDTVFAPEVEEIATQIAKGCACLPLANVTVGGSLYGLKTTREWRNALSEMIVSRKDANDGESQVFQRLKFSYSRLENKVLQDCFLYCSLYPENYAIPVTALIELWIAEDLIVGRNSVKASFDQGHNISRVLTCRCLLESFTDELGVEFLRMHALIRDMALRITSTSPRFLVKAGESHESVPDEDWSEDLEKISFMGSRITELPILPPVCPQLTTLLLNEIGLEEIPDSFFTNMPCLKVLDLSDNKIMSLPGSISNLENLCALILSRCHQLTDVPSLGTLKALKVFVLTSSSIEEVPEGIEELVNLTKLDLGNNKKLGMFPGWKLRRLLKLQFLRIDWTEAHVRVEDLLFLRELKVVAVQFDNVNGLNRYVTSQNFQWLEKYRLLTGGSIVRGPLNGKEVCINSGSEPFGSGVSELVLPADADSFLVEKVHDLTSLSAIPSLKDARNLRRCEVRSCDGLESIFSSSSLSETGQISLGTVESLDLVELPRFRVLFDGIATPLRIYFNIKELYIWRCETVKNIFCVQFLQNFPNLEKLNVEECENVEDIIVEIPEMSDLGYHQDDSNSISLPILKSLQLWDLPRLKSIYNGEMVCQSIEEVDVHGCPMVRRLPLSLHMDGEQATAPPSLKYIRGQDEWWESLEWEDAHTKTILQPFLEISSY